MTANRAHREKGFREERYRQLIQGLVEERKRLGVSQEELASRLGRHQPFVSRFETGERRLDVVEFTDVARALGVMPEELVRSIP